MIIISLVYKGRKYNDIEINETDNVKQIIDIFYKKLNMPEEKKLYTKDKILLKFNDAILNENENDLNKTANELGVVDDDAFTLISTEEINAGKKMNKK
jgi:hypothetical protein